MLIMEPETILFFADADPEWRAAVCSYIDREKLRKNLQKLIIAYAIQKHYQLNRHQLPIIINAVNKKAKLNLTPAKKLSFWQFCKLKRKAKNYSKLNEMEIIDSLLKRN